MRPAPLPKTAMAHSPPANPFPSAGGSTPASAPTYPSPASCPHSTADVLPQCHPESATFANAGTDLLPARTGIPAETLTPSPHARSSVLSPSARRTDLHRRPVRHDREIGPASRRGLSHREPRSPIPAG